MLHSDNIKSSNLINLEKITVSCPLCGKDDFKIISAHHDRLANVAGGFPLVKCNNCSLLYANPRPKEKDLSYFYPDDYPAYNCLFKDAKKTKGTLNYFLYRSYFTFRKFNFAKMIWKVIIPHIKVEKELDLRLVKLDISSNILDIGCSTGFFLDHIRWLTQCNINGVELNSCARKIANKLLGEGKVLPSLDDIDGKRNFFDVITMWFVFEHLFDPSESLKQISAILKNDGKLVMAIPNLDSWCCSLFGVNWVSFDVPRHLQLFTIANLKEILRKHNFTIYRVKYINSSYDFLRSLQLTFFNRKRRQSEKVKASSTQVNFFIQLIVWPFCAFAALFRKSSSIVIYAKRNL